MVCRSPTRPDSHNGRRESLLGQAGSAQRSREQRCGQCTLTEKRKKRSGGFSVVFGVKEDCAWGYEVCTVKQGSSSVVRLMPEQSGLLKDRIGQEDSNDKHGEAA